MDKTTICQDVCFFLGGFLVRMLQNLVCLWCMYILLYFSLCFTAKRWYDICLSLNRSKLLVGCFSSWRSTTQRNRNSWKCNRTTSQRWRFGTKSATAKARKIHFFRWRENLINPTFLIQLVLQPSEMQQDGRALVLKFKRPTGRMEEYCFFWGGSRTHRNRCSHCSLCVSQSLREVSYLKLIWDGLGPIIFSTTLL